MLSAFWRIALYTIIYYIVYFIHTHRYARVILFYGLCSDDDDDDDDIDRAKCRGRPCYYIYICRAAAAVIAAAVFALLIASWKSPDDCLLFIYLYFNFFFLSFAPFAPSARYRFRYEPPRRTLWRPASCVRIPTRNKLRSRDLQT